MRTIYSVYIFPAAAALLLWSVTFCAAQELTPIPSTTSVPRGQTSTRSITYQFTNLPPDTGALFSEGGTFSANMVIIGEVNRPLTTSKPRGTALVTEGLVIPTEIVEKALRMHTNTITYHRLFSYMALVLETDVTIFITSEAGADFGINRVDMYFENKRPEITVSRNQAGLRAYADIRYVGSGLLQGFWEVDGRLLSTVNQHLVFAGSVTLISPEIPALPTFDPGSHVVRFVITSPSPELTTPSIVYFVLPEESGKLSTGLLSPEDGATLEGAPFRFRWKGSAMVGMYIIRFMDKPEGVPVFSAYTRETYYDLPQRIPNGSMTPGLKYYWNVTGVGEDGNAVSLSPTRSFTTR